MSCHLSKRACLANVRAIKAALTFTEETANPDEYSAENWNSGWDFDEQIEEKCNETVKLKREDQSWLQDCVSSLSPAADVLALAYGQHAVFLTSKWDASEESEMKLKFVSSFEGKLATEKDETVTSILCLPLASQKRSLQGGPDWTCIIAGFSSGFIRIYTENADLLLSQKLHEEPVGHLRCKTHVPLHFSNYSDQPDELVIVFSTVIVVIDGFGLFQTLRACRNQLARAAAGRQEVVQPPPLSYKKWGFHEHDKLMDCEAAGVINTTPFDHLVTESVRKGFYGTVKANMPSNCLLVTTGCNPYVGYYHASEGSSQLLLTDVVHAVASKLMNFISNYNTGGLGGFMGFNQPKEQKPQPKIEPATILPLRFGLYDKRRQGISMSLSPNKCLAAITDAFGRVILFDIFKGVAVRMWKGYRDAQCGWVEVEDAIVKDAKHDREKKRRVFFLVIYAPRRGILEVWCTQQGPRVAAFNVGKTGRLYCPGYAMVGGSVLSSNLAKDHLCSCYFLDVDGVMKKIIVPFHLVLSEKNSRRARDLHLLRELKLTLKNVTKGKSFEIIKILHDMRTSCTRIQALENILSSRYSTVELVEEVALSLLGHLRKQ
ncbi:rab3 GTPase-activating protein non-catalytic subunit-like, partial [Uloborus diversus]|uniref:rab3 GTPase-activating protein non-catalytic subunit-like n=1 Tax=Uloborus diversus TaxID=327109 RepID=UPI00240A0FF5